MAKIDDATRDRVFAVNLASITWLASADASNVNGVILPVDGGWAAI